METKYNKWTFLGDLGRSPEKTSLYLWKVQCECGYIGEKNKYHIMNGDSKQCERCASKSRVAGIKKKCAPREVPIIIIGMKKNTWTVARKCLIQDNYWECECECGQVKVFSAFKIAGDKIIVCLPCWRKKIELRKRLNRESSFGKKSQEEKEENLERNKNKISPVNNICHRFRKD